MAESQTPTGTDVGSDALLGWPLSRYYLGVFTTPSASVTVEIATLPATTIEALDVGPDAQLLPGGATRCGMADHRKKIRHPEMPVGRTAYQGSMFGREWLEAWWAELSRLQPKPKQLDPVVVDLSGGWSVLPPSQFSMFAIREFRDWFGSHRRPDRDRGGDAELLESLVAEPLILLESSPVSGHRLLDLASAASFVAVARSTDRPTFLLAGLSAVLLFRMLYPSAEPLSDWLRRKVETRLDRQDE